MKELIVRIDQPGHMLLSEKAPFARLRFVSAMARSNAVEIESEMVKFKSDSHRREPPEQNFRRQKLDPRRVICEILCVRTVDRHHKGRWAEDVSEVRARIMIGESAGFTLRYVGFLGR